MFASAHGPRAARALHTSASVASRSARRAKADSASPSARPSRPASATPAIGAGAALRSRQAGARATWEVRTAAHTRATAPPGSAQAAAAPAPLLVTHSARADLQAYLEPERRDRSWHGAAPANYASAARDQRRAHRYSAGAAHGSSSSSEPDGSSSTPSTSSSATTLAHPAKPKTSHVANEKGSKVAQPNGKGQQKAEVVDEELDPFDLDTEPERVRDAPPHLEHFAPDEVEEVLRDERLAPKDKWAAACDPPETGTLVAADVDIVGVPPMRDAKVATLGRGLQRVLFNPGVTHLRDPRTGVWNFGSSLASIPEPEKFAFHRTPQYITASQDEELTAMAAKYKMRFVGSTSTLTQSLAQIYFAMSGGRGVDLSTLSQEFAEEPKDFTAGAQLPACLTIRRLPSGVYAIDNDKRHDVDENVLSDYGRILEKLLTTDKADFARFLTTSPEDTVPQAEREEREAYRYSHSKTILMRSQLDCRDSRLPGTGVFDIKTRACYPIRHDRANYQKNKSYAIFQDHGMDDSFEREYYDLCRSGMLKFSLQARIGDMDGIFVAYHNTERCFGFQYLPLSELDQRLFGSTELANQAFHLSVGVLEAVLERAAALFPGQTLDVVVHRPRGAARAGTVVAYVRPHAWDARRARPARAIVVRFASEVDGRQVDGPVAFAAGDEERKGQTWKIRYSLAVTRDDLAGQDAAEKGWRDAVGVMERIRPLNVPEGATAKEMAARDAARRRDEAKAPAPAAPAGEVGGDGAAAHAVPETEAAAAAAAAAAGPAPAFARTVWKEPDARIRQLRLAAQASGARYAEIQKGWKAEGAKSQALAPSA